MVRQYSSVAVETTLTGNITNSATSIIVGSTSGFPVVFPYTLSIDAENASKELVEVTAAAGTTLTVTRGIDGTSGVSHSLGAVVRHDHSARDFREPQEHIAATTNVHGITGTLADTDSAQSFTNKNLASGTNTFPASLVTLAGAQTLTNKNLADPTNVFPSSLATLTGTQAFTNKDLASGTNTFPTSLVTLTGAQTLTNKVLTSPTINTPTVSGGTLTSPAIVSPTITGTGTAALSSLTVGGVSVIGTRVEQVVYNANGTFSKGSYTWAKYALIEGVAAGGAGGGAAATSTGEASCGSGGGAGQWGQTLVPISSLAASETVTCPAGALGASGLDGNNGSNASFGTWLVLNGGSGGNASSVGSGVGVTTGGAPGGGSALRTGGQAISGAGAASSYGPGGQGRASSTPSNGSNAPSPGAGGSGAVNAASAAAKAGGAGGAAQIIVTLFG